MKEKHIQNEILRTFGSKRLMRLWRANVLAVRIGNRFVRAGIVGQADLTGILFDGRRIEVEVKSAHGRQTTDQRNFQRMIERFNGIYILARSVEDVERTLQQVGYDVKTL